MQQSVIVVDILLKFMDAGKYYLLSGKSVSSLNAGIHNNFYSDNSICDNIFPYWKFIKKKSLNALVLLNKRNALFYWISNLDIQKLITLYLTLLGDNDISCNENISLFHFVQNFFCKVMSFKNMNSSNFTASSSIIKHVRVQMMYLQLVKS